MYTFLTKPNSPLYTLIIWIILLCVTILLAVTPLSSADIWWHLKTGEIILQTKQIPRVDFFSFTAAGNKWISHEWLSEVVLSRIEQSFGINGLIFFKVILLLFVCVCLFAIMRGKLSNVFLSVIGIIGFLFLSRHRFFVRPHLFSFCFFSLLFLCLEKYNQNTRNRAWLTGVPLIIGVWTNMHGGVVFGLMFLSLFSIPWFIRFTENRFLSREKTLITVIVILCFGVSVINPHGWDVLLYPFTLIREGYIAENREWLSPFDARLNGYYLRIYFICFSTLVVLSYCSSRKKPTLREFLIIGTFFALGMKSQRNIPFFGIVALPYCIKNFTLYCERLPNSMKTKLSILLKPLSIAALIILTLSIAKNGVPIATQGRGVSRMGLGINKAVMPVDAITFLQSHSIKGNVFNAYEYGGFVIYTSYPDLKVFIDGRADVYGGELYETFRRALSVPHYFEILEQTYPFEIILLPYEKAHSALHAYLHNSPSWKLTYFDDVALVYLQNTASYEPLIKQVGFEHISPVIFDKSNKDMLDNLDRYIAEYVKQLQSNPQVQITYVHLGTLYQLNQQYDLAENIFLQGIARFGESYVFRTHLGTLYRNAARLEQAEKCFEKAVSLNSYKIDALGNLALVYYEQNKLRDAEKLFKKILAKHPADDTARSMLRIIDKAKNN